MLSLTEDKVEPALKLCARVSRVIFDQTLRGQML